MKCIAVDDEPLALKIISRYCDQAPSLRLMAAYTDPLEGLSAIRSMEPDLLFLDIRMPDISGIDLAGALKEDALIIFTTAHREYAVEGFELNVVDYLLKPFGFDRFLTACEKAEERLRRSLQQKPAAEQPAPSDMLIFKCNYRNIHLPFNDILYIEALDNYVKIVTASKTYVPTMTLKSILSLLPEQEFVRVHKSFVIPVARIKSYNREAVVTDSIETPVGRTFRKDFFERMNILKADR
ncbi:MAG: LytTR family DNA-binding domain-containing protein [Tannerellaceae bacterium]|jgi:DNA-binding LytR/AlgR family response regulator|nr:LytTR family DNA-binding domain-containing protein [Tannerellaceae bacterium]